MDKKELRVTALTASFVNGIPCGVYQQIQSDGKIVEGMRSDLKQSQVGIMRHPDGSSYIGQMQDLYHGKGILTSADGSVKKGMFIKGEFKLAQDFNEDFLK